MIFFLVNCSRSSVEIGYYHHGDCPHGHQR